MCPTNCIICSQRSLFHNDNRIQIESLYIYIDQQHTVLMIMTRSFSCKINNFELKRNLNYLQSKIFFLIKKENIILNNSLRKQKIF